VTGFSYKDNGRDITNNLSPTMRSMSENRMPGNLAVAYTIQQNDGGNHKRKDRPNGGMYVQETDKALTVGSTDMTAVISPTLRKSIGGTLSYGRDAIPISNIGVRRLTPIECERLQGFPDGFTDGQADSIRYRQLGNAVCVPVAEWIGQRIIERFK
jgi:site-specific DNA-cytosine methylase